LTLNLIFTDATKRFLGTKADSYFEKTKFFTEAFKILSEKNIVVLTGHPGEGKTAMAANLALECGLKEENCVKLECARDWEDVNWSLRCFTTVIIDDIFGGFCLDHKRLSEWKSVVGDIEQCAKNGELKVIITSRHYIIEEANEDMDKVTLFNKDAKLTICLNSRYLPATELRQILKATLERNQITKTINLNECVSNAIGKFNPTTGEREQYVSGFPECAALFATDTFISQGPAFFKRPEQHFKAYIKQLYKSKDTEQFYKFIALVTVWANDHHTINDTDLQNPMKVSPHVQNIADCFGISIDHTFLEALKHSFYAYSSYLLVYNTSSGEYTFSHNLINEMVGVVLGKYKPRECIKLCQREFLMERLTLSEIEESEMKVSIPPSMYTALCEKMIQLICPDDCVEIQDRLILKHPSFETQSFIQVFLQYTVKNKFESKLFNAPCWAKWNADRNVGTKLYLLDYIVANNMIVFAEEIIMNITSILYSDTQVSGDSICTIMRKRPSLLKPLFESGRAHPNSPCYTWYGGVSYPLIEASSENLIDLVQQLLFYGADPNIANSHRSTALHLAAQYGHNEICKVLLGYRDDVNVVKNIGRDIYRRDFDSAVGGRYSAVTDEHLMNKARVNAKDIGEKTPLHRAAYSGFVNVVNTLLNNGAEVNIVNNRNKTALHYATLNGHDDVIRELLINKANINVKDSFGRSPLCWGALKGHNDAVKMLLKNGADVNFIDDNNQTALHMASQGGHCNVIEELIKSKAIINVNDKDGLTPLHFAADMGHSYVTKMLLNNGADPNIVDIRNLTALHVAAYEGHCGVIEELLHNKADVNAKSRTGHTPLHWAILGRQEDVVKILVNNGAETHTVLYFAAREGHCGVIEELLKSKADVNAKSSNGRTPLHKAASHAHKDAVKLLLNNGAEVNAKDGKGRTPLHCAAFKGHRYAVKMLLDDGACVNIVDDNNQTTSQSTAEGKHCGIIEETLNSKESINSNDNNERTSLHEAASEEHNDAEKLLLEKGAELETLSRGLSYIWEALLNSSANINANDSDMNTSLHLAESKGHDNGVKMLLKNGADVQTVDTNSQTTLHSAATIRHCDVIKELLNSKADINAMDTDGKTPLHLAACNGVNDAVKLLLNNGADVNSLDKENCTALYEAVASGKHNIITELINFQADVNLKDSVGDSPLHIARRLKDEEAVTILINNGAYV